MNMVQLWKERELNQHQSLGILLHLIDVSAGNGFAAAKIF
jgi:hypothetical protein